MNHRISSVFALCGFLTLGGFSSALPVSAADPTIEAAATSPALQKLMTMFSAEIKTTLNACREQGGVNLVAGAQADGSVLCANGEPKATVPYDQYLGTLSDMMAAAMLVSLKTTIDTNPGVSPEMIANFLTSPSGTTVLQNALQSAIARTDLLPTASPESRNLLVGKVIERLVPTLQSTNNLATLIGTAEQYGQVVSNFCSTPGMSVAQAQQTVPGLSSVQLFAVCVQESGLAEEIQQRQNSRS